METNKDAALVDSFFLPGGILDPDDEDDTPIPSVPAFLNPPSSNNQNDSTPIANGGGRGGGGNISRIPSNPWRDDDDDVDQATADFSPGEYMSSNDVVNPPSSLFSSSGQQQHQQQTHLPLHQESSLFSNNRQKNHPSSTIPAIRPPPGFNNVCTTPTPTTTISQRLTTDILNNSSLPLVIMNDCVGAAGAANTTPPEPIMSIPTIQKVDNKLIQRPHPPPPEMTTSRWTNSNSMALTGTNNDINKYNDYTEKITHQQRQKVQQPISPPRPPPQQQQLEYKQEDVFVGSKSSKILDFSLPTALLEEGKKKNNGDYDPQTNPFACEESDCIRSNSSIPLELDWTSVHGIYTGNSLTSSLSTSTCGEDDDEDSTGGDGGGTTTTTTSQDAGGAATTAVDGDVAENIDGNFFVDDDANAQEKNTKDKEITKRHPRRIKSNGEGIHSSNFEKTKRSKGRDSAIAKHELDMEGNKPRSHEDKYNDNNHKPTSNKEQNETTQQGKNVSSPRPGIKIQILQIRDILWSKIIEIWRQLWVSLVAIAHFPIDFTFAGMDLIKRITTRTRSRISSSLCLSTTRRRIVNSWRETIQLLSDTAHAVVSLVVDTFVLLRSVLTTIFILLKFFLSSLNQIWKYSFSEAIEEPDVSICYLVFSFMPTVCSLLVRIINIPHWMPHLLTAVAVYSLCRPVKAATIDMETTTSSNSIEEEKTQNKNPNYSNSRRGGGGGGRSQQQQRKHEKATTNTTATTTGDDDSGCGDDDDEFPPRDERACKTILNVLKLVLPLFFIVDGFSTEFGTIMGVSDASRLTTAFMMCLVRKNLVSSPIGWISWSIQVLIATHFPSSIFADHVVSVVGLASIRLMRYLDCQRLLVHKDEQRHQQHQQHQRNSTNHRKS